MLLGFFGFANHASATTYTWNPFLGGSGSGSGATTGVAIDTSGNVYVIGQSYDTGDAFVKKLSSNGALIWSTSLGGTADDYVSGVVVDASGNIYVSGTSGGTWGTPIRPFVADYSAFVVKLSNTGTIVWNTFLGGSGIDFGNGISIDTSGNIYVTGYSQGTWGSPIRSSGNAFVAKLTNAGAITWNTLLGSGNESGDGIVVDISGNLYVSGYGGGTWGTPIRDSGGVFVAKLTSAGAIIWNTFLGASGNADRGLAVDTSGNVYVAGQSEATWGTPVRTYYGSGRDGWAAKLDSTGHLTWNTFLGGSAEDQGYGIAVDTSGNSYVTGSSYGAWGTSPVRAFSSGLDAWMAKINTSGTLVWNTFLGGSGTDGCQSWLLAVDSGGNIYMGGESDITWGTPPRAYTSGTDGWVAKVTSAGALADVPASHTITATVGTNGSISPTGTASTVNSNGSITPAGTTTLNYGASQTYSISANDPYTTNVIVDGASQGPLTTYTFTNVTTNHTILADFSLVLGGGGGAGVSSTGSTSDSSSQPQSPSTPTVENPTPPPPPTPSSPAPTATTQQQRTEAIAQIKQQLIELITQLIQMLTLQAQAMGR
ncbi:MAG: SBBP repeat-containing protein [Candidatus Staskawiczbacteria bacterium]|nr:SBBP repeat-containing protein [Candidatus Staskawiczbacteria bacterium]